MRDDLDFDLDRALADAGERLWVPPGDVDAVIGRGRRVAARRRTMVAAATAVVVAAAAVGVGLASRTDDDDGREVATAAGVTRGPVEVSWQQFTPSSALGWAQKVGGEDVLYALSTAPGQRDVNDSRANQVVWRSEDGIEWSAVSDLGDDLYLSELAAGRDSRVYAVGTAPVSATVGSRRSSDLVAGWSDDGGSQWQTAKLPFDMQAIVSRSTVSTIADTEVAVGPETVVAVAAPFAQVDVRALLPDGVTAPNGWAVTETGIDVLGPAPDEWPCPHGDGGAYMAEQGEPGEVHPVVCGGDGADPLVITPQERHGVIASYTWGELGVDGDLLLAARRQPIAFVADAGSTEFERVDLPDVGRLAGPLALLAVETGFDLVVPTNPDAVGGQTADLVVLHSDDGRSWAQVDGVPGGPAFVAAAGKVGGTTTLVGHGPEGAILVQSDGAGDWRTTSLETALDPAATDGKTALVGSAGVGPAGIVVALTLVPDDGESSEPVDHRLVVSRDGVTWAEEPLGELVGGRIRSVHRVHVSAEQFVVAVALAAEGAEEQQPATPSRQVVLVGTPA